MHQLEVNQEKLRLNNYSKTFAHKVLWRFFYHQLIHLSFSLLFLILDQWDEAVAMVTELSLPEIFQSPTRNDWRRLHRYLEITLDERKNKERELSSRLDLHNHCSSSCCCSHQFQRKKPSIFQSHPFNGGHIPFSQDLSPWLIRRF